MYIILAILAFGILIAGHELGHFLVAKACGVKVNEFALGMGPKILKKQGKETLYTLRAFPIGGFCAMEGEDEDSDDPRAFGSKKVWQKILILIAGAAMNFLIGFLLVLCIAPHANFAEPVISGFMDGCPYESADGLLAGDRIVSVDGHRTYFTGDFSEYIGRGGETHKIVLIRDGKRVTLRDYKMTLVEYTLEDGTTVQKYGLYFSPRQTGFFANVKYAWFESLNFVRIVWRSLGDLITGTVSVKELSGPVGIVGFVNQVESAAASPLEAYFNFFYIFALIAVNLAVMNLLPIPALDGGRVFFLLVTWVIERISRKKLDPKYEGYIHTAGFVLLMGLMVFVFISDVWKLIAK